MGRWTRQAAQSLRGEPVDCSLPSWGYSSPSSSTERRLEHSTVRTAGTQRAAVRAVSVDSTESAGAPVTLGPVGLAGTADGPVPAAVPAAMPAPAPEPLVVTLHASDRSWVSATADGTRVVYRTLEAGTTETLRGSREITIRVGNAGALTWSVNGRAGEVMGAPGEVKTVTVGRERP